MLHTWFHGRFLGETSIRLWTVLGGIAGTVGIIIALLIYFLPAGAQPVPDTNVKPPILRLVKVAARDATVVDAQSHVPNEPDAAGKIKAVTVDVTIENTGDYPAYISEADLVFRFHEQLQKCKGEGGPVEVSGSYSVAVPTDARAVPFTIARQMDFQVEPRSIDRLAVTVGPQKIGEGEAHWLYNFDVSLRYGDNQSLSVGTVSAVSPPTNVNHFRH